MKVFGRIPNPEIKGFQPELRVIDYVATRKDDPERGPQFETSDMALRAAAEGLGVAIGSTALVEDDLKQGRLVAPFGIRLASQCGYYFVMPEDRKDQPKIAAFRNWLLEETRAARPLQAA